MKWVKWDTVVLNYLTKVTKLINNGTGIRDTASRILKFITLNRSMFNSLINVYRYVSSYELCMSTEFSFCSKHWPKHCRISIHKSTLSLSLSFNIKKIRMEDKYYKIDTTFYNKKD